MDTVIREKEAPIAPMSAIPYRPAGGAGSEERYGRLKKKPIYFILLSSVIGANVHLVLGVDKRTLHNTLMRLEYDFLDQSSAWIYIPNLITHPRLKEVIPIHNKKKLKGLQCSDCGPAEPCILTECNDGEPVTIDQSLSLALQPPYSSSSKTIVAARSCDKNGNFLTLHRNNGALVISSVSPAVLQSGGSSSKYISPLVKPVSKSVLTNGTS